MLSLATDSGTCRVSVCVCVCEVDKWGRSVRERKKRQLTDSTTGLPPQPNMSILRCLCSLTESKHDNNELRFELTNIRANHNLKIYVHFLLASPEQSACYICATATRWGYQAYARFIYIWTNSYMWNGDVKSDNNTPVGTVKSSSTANSSLSDNDAGAKC